MKFTLILVASTFLLISSVAKTQETEDVPRHHLGFFAGPGYEFHGKKDKFLVRIGVAYEWELKHGWSLSPEIIADFLDGGAKTYVAGIAIGHGF